MYRGHFVLDIVFDKQLFMNTREKRPFYFYVLHDSKVNNKYNFDYLETVKRAFLIKSTRLLTLANNVKDLREKMDEKYLLDNGIDVRELYFTGEIKEISKESYDMIVEDDKRILANMSEKSKNLLLQFGFDLDGWHRPFMIEAKNKSYLKTALKRKFGELPTIIFKD